MGLELTKQTRLSLPPHPKPMFKLVKGLKLELFECPSLLLLSFKQEKRALRPRGPARAQGPQEAPVPSALVQHRNHRDWPLAFFREELF